MIDGVAAPASVSPSRLDSLLTAGVLGAFVFFVCFPYVQVVPLHTDTQPYALLLSALIFVAARERRMPLELVLLLLAFVLSVPVVLLQGFDFDAVRSVANYGSLFLVPYATYHALKLYPGIVESAVRLAVYGWFAVGLVQILIFPDFLLGLVGRGVGTAGRGGRGVLGLAPEPTHYAVICLFLLLVLAVQRTRSRHLYVLLVVQIVFFARSSLAVLLLLVFLAYYLLSSLFSVRRLLIGAACVLALWAAAMILLQTMGPALAQLRMYRLAALALSNPKLLLLVDQSVNERFSHLFFSIYGALSNGLLPRGYSSWLPYLLEVSSRYDDLVRHVTMGTRIMSGYGAALFELGFIGLLVPASFTLAAYRFYRPRVRPFLLLSGCVHTMMLTSIPVGFPLFGFLLGYLAHGGADRARERGPDAPELPARAGGGESE